MRFFALVVALFVLLTPLSATAQEQSPFSAPPAGMPDFGDWGRWRTLEGSIAITSPDASALEQAVTRHGLCQADALPCTVFLSTSFSFLYRCIAQNDQEFDCRQRMAWKRRDVVAAVGRYVMARTGKRVEGFVLEHELADTRYFTRATGETEWRELPVGGPAAPRTEQEDLYNALYALSKR